MAPAVDAGEGKAKQAMCQILRASPHGATATPPAAARRTARPNLHNPWAKPGAAPKPSAGRSGAVTAMFAVW
jgi:hypothetical protein